MGARSQLDRQKQVEHQEERAEKAADALRAVLFALATAGVAAAYALHGELQHDYWRAAATLFIIGLACILRSWFLVKARALARRDALLEKRDLPSIGKWSPHSSWLWDTATALLLVAGAIILAIGLG